MLITKECHFDEVFKEILLSETYEVLNKYKCFDKIKKVLDNHQLCPCDFFDFVCFFRNSKVARIIKNQKEIIINDIQPNQIFIIDFRGESFSSIYKKHEDCMEKSKRKYSLCWKNILHKINQKLI